MKLLLSVLLIGLALSGVLTLPARNNPQDDAEVIKVPSRPQSAGAGEPDFHNFGGVIDTGAGYPFLQSNPASFSPVTTGFFDSFDDLFRRLRTRLWPVIASDSGEDGTGAGAAGADDSSDDIGSAFSFGLRPLTAFTPLTPLNPKNGNKTSTVKVVDGHKVEINETVYGDSNSLFRVRVVNVRPLDSGEEVAEGVLTSQGEEFKPAAAPATSAPAVLPTRRGEFDDDDDDNSRREPLEKQPKDNEVRDIDEPQSTPTTKTTPSYTTTTTKLATSSPADSEAEGTQLEIRREIMANLDTDSMVAAVEAKAEAQAEALEQEQFEAEDAALFENADEVHRLGQLQHREREELESSDDEDGEVAAPIEMSDTFNDEWDTLEQEEEHELHEGAVDQDHELDQEADAGNNLDNHIDIYEGSLPIDLSHDIAVNDLAAADPDFPVNPDAELISGPSVIKTMPMFEKLSMGPRK
ncbi:uncharacterized protein LOC111079286 [Drosophila obscura]|uniref:uncharacterized protein LOC111079286 n=1 Tax=Drosophila obscura TaxID=7282 RepID=UPI001BB2C47E|nr:uncharacterized protein LOC111079286 [Drosophila obscura]